MDWEAIGQEAVQLLSEFIKVETINPPGNEYRATDFLGRIFEREDIPFQTFESDPGRKSIYARLNGDGSKRPLILLSHSDVVPVDREYWSVDPFGGVVKDGYIWGRGALDMKNIGIAELVAFLTLNRQRTPLKRDIILLNTADEEAGGRMGAGWMTEHHPELFTGAEFLINESGKGRMENGTALYSIDITEKTPCWVRLSAAGEPGHGSRPKPNSSVNRLVRALGRVLEYTPPLKVTAPVETYFKGIAHLQKGSRRRQFQDIRTAVKDPAFLADLNLTSQYAAVLRNTVSVTMMQGSNKINIIPQIATAELDCRLLPGEEPTQFIEELRKVIDDDAIVIEPILTFGNGASPFESDFVRAVETVVSRHHKRVHVVPNILSGFTDSHFFRDLGVRCYGFSPFILPDNDLRGIHGNDERISVENMKRGPKVLFEIVEVLNR